MSEVVKTSTMLVQLEHGVTGYICRFGTLTHMKNTELSSKLQINEGTWNNLWFLFHRAYFHVLLNAKSYLEFRIYLLWNTMGISGTYCSCLFQPKLGTIKRTCLHFFSSILLDYELPKSGSPILACYHEEKKTTLI